MLLYLAYSILPHLLPQLLSIPYQPIHLKTSYYGSIDQMSILSEQKNSVLFSFLGIKHICLPPMQEDFKVVVDAYIETITSAYG